MKQRVLDLGNCDHDHGLIRSLVEGGFSVELVRCHTADQALAELRARPCALVLVNRLLDQDGSEGLAAIERIKADPQLSATPCMLISNHIDAQAAAVAAGALPGFGKRAIGSPAARECLSAVLHSGG